MSMPKDRIRSSAKNKPVSVQGFVGWIHIHKIQLNQLDLAKTQYNLVSTVLTSTITFHNTFDSTLVFRT